MVDQNLRFTLETSYQTLIDVSQFENHSYSFSGMGKRFRIGGFGGPHLYPVTAVGTQTLGSERDLNEFTGSGFLDLFLDAQGGVSDHFTRGGGVLQGLVKAGADITVCYDYIPVSPQVAVPEVGTCLAGGFALLLLVLTRWKGQPRTP